MNILRVLLGLVVIVAVPAIGAKFIASVTAPLLPYWPLPSIMLAFVAAFTGGLISKRGLLTPSIGLFLALWGYMIYGLYIMAAPLGQASVLSIVQFNFAAIASSLAALTLGITSGQWLANRRSRGTIATT